MQIKIKHHYYLSILLMVGCAGSSDLDSKDQNQKCQPDSTEKEILVGSIARTMASLCGNDIFYFYFPDVNLEILMRDRLIEFIQSTNMLINLPCSYNISVLKKNYFQKNHSVECFLDEYGSVSIPRDSLLIPSRIMNVCGDTLIAQYTVVLLGEEITGVPRILEVSDSGIVTLAFTFEDLSHVKY